jgi:hypothetical protein
MLARRPELCLEDKRLTEDESIRQCAPKVLDEWRDYYLKNVRSIGQIESLGKKLYIKIKDNHIGIQIKPVNQGIQLSQIFKEKDLQSKTHEKFTRQYGGKVFYIFSSKAGEKKEIRNKEVIDEIRQEMERLKK